MTNKSWISLIKGIIRQEHSELFSLEFEKIAEFDFVYTLASTKFILTNQHQNVCDYSISDELYYGSIKTEHLELSALELEKWL